ncbi:putative protein ASPARTIC PROTEASE IN GUARD CELL 1 [Iris pallida]|uniref:Uncharacterized protein n=1 Tax=Iris pallida TaxID=29817 RepID=A0AAX6FPR5_IRIPA|nr:putative protein ASPARTIC PROTEASE IN GUARD CELL 1 [Iris pallida]
MQKIPIMPSDGRHIVNCCYIYARPPSSTLKPSSLASLPMSAPHRARSCLRYSASTKRLLPT